MGDVMSSRPLQKFFELEEPVTHHTRVRGLVSAKAFEKIIDYFFFKITRHVEHVIRNSEFLANILRDLKGFGAATDILLQTIRLVLPNGIFKRNTDRIPAFLL